MSNRTVLLVEDEEQLRSYYAEWLSDGCEVREAGSIDEAVAKFDRDVDIAILDRRLPNGHAEGLVPRFSDRNPDCKFALISGVSPNWDVMDVDFDAYVEKPIREEDFDSLLASLEGDESASLAGSDGVVL